jgi:hypothetical protein
MADTTRAEKIERILIAMEWQSNGAVDNSGLTDKRHSVFLGSRNDGVNTWNDDVVYALMNWNANIESMSFLKVATPEGELTTTIPNFAGGVWVEVPFNGSTLGDFKYEGKRYINLRSRYLLGRMSVDPNVYTQAYNLSKQIEGQVLADGGFVYTRFTLNNLSDHSVDYIYAFYIPVYNWVMKYR